MIIAAPGQISAARMDRPLPEPMPTRFRASRTALLVTAALALTPWAGWRPQAAAAPEPVVYTLRFPAPESHVAEVEAQVPTGGQTSLDLMLPAWSPGYYAIGDYARDVSDFAARTSDGRMLRVDHPRSNHWIVVTDGAPAIVVSYQLLCRSQFVTGSWVGTDYAVINGPSTYITPTGGGARPEEVHLDLPPVWPQSITSLDPAPDGQPNHYRGPNYDVFIDSPIVAGRISTHQFEVGGATHVLADFGDLGAWDGQAAADALKRIVTAHWRMIGALPFKRYVFLNAFRRGQGGLEHLNSSLLSSSPGPTSPMPTLRWLKYVSHEYFHAINVKRLRPIELGPFDYEKLPHTPSLWIAEGLTTYYGDLAVVRSGVGSLDDYLAGLSGEIRAVQTSPGRLVQTLEQASLTVGATSRSGVGGDRNTTVSYYDKGTVVGLLLDARIRHATHDAHSLDDVMRLAYARYGGARGYTPAEFQATASEVAGTDLSGFFHTVLATTHELDYREALDWFGLRFAEPGSADPTRAWALEVRPDATPAQAQHLHHLVTQTTR
jgi:predicted metalloprotease with PDZ domain